MRIVVLFFSVMLVNTSINAQYKSSRIVTDNKLYFKNSDVHFATVDEQIVSDSIISGYIVKDIRGILLATIMYKAGREIADSANNNYTTAYTEIYFTKNILACQVQGIICRNDLKNIFEKLLYNDSSSYLPKNFTYNYELDYEKVENFCTENEIIYTDKIDVVYNPIRDIEKLAAFSTCNKKPLSKKGNATKQQSPVKYVPKKG